MAETILNINNLHKKYGEVHALKGITFSVMRGQIYGILGPNGSGKTTTLGIILGVLNKNKGEFNWFGKNLSKETKQKLGAILETPNFYPYLSGRKNLKITALNKGLDYSDIDSVLERTGLLDRGNSKFKTYSLGMKQRLAIAAALLGDPEVLVFDEPTNGLDPQGIADVRSLIIDIAKEGKTIILASHLLDEVQKVCTHAVIMKKGQILFEGPITEEDTENFIISSTSEGFMSAIESQERFSKLEEKDSRVIINAKDMSAEEINKYFVEKGIYLNHLEAQRKGLEKIFLEITGLDK